MRHTISAIVAILWGGAVVGKTLATGGLPAGGSGGYLIGSQLAFGIGLVMLFAGLVTLKKRGAGIEPPHPGAGTSLLIVALAACLTLLAARLGEPGKRELCQASMAHFLDLVEREYGPEGVEEYSAGDLVETCRARQSTRWARCIAAAATVDQAVDDCR